MFNLLKRLVAPPAKPVPRPPPRRRKASAPPSPSEPLPVPEVTEGNDHTDWDLWEDSVNTLDSRMQSLTPSARIYGNENAPSQYDELDAFARVGKNRDL